jgi:hypothetical protein
VIVRAHEPERKWLSADLTSWCPQGDWASSATGCRGKGRTKVSKSNYAIVEDLRIGVRLKISALWIAILFLFAYGDIFGFFQEGQIEEVIGGEVSGIEITETFLFAVSVYIAIASVMVFLSLVLRSRVNRWTNIVLPILYISLSRFRLSVNRRRISSS